MARLQILELPEGSGDDRPPFVLVIDQAPADLAGFDALRRDLGDHEDFLKRTGARAVLVFEETIDIPVNDVPLGADGNPLFVQDVRAQDGPRLATERTGIARDMDRLAKWKNELLDALGMDRTRDWDDIRNAARGLRKQRDAQAEAIERVRQASAEPDAMNAQQEHPGVWRHGYHCGVLAAKSALRPRNEPTTKPTDA
jgi:hypothetical protein